MSDVRVMLKGREEVMMRLSDDDDSSEREEEAGNVCLFELCMKKDGE